MFPLGRISLQRIGAVRAIVLSEKFLHPRSVRCAASFSTSTNHITSIQLEDDFHKIADESLERLNDFLAPLEEDEDVELELSMGVLKLRVPSAGGPKSWVINKQTPNRQLWWSSPISGPRRYEWKQNKDSSDDLVSIRSWTHTRAVAVPGGSVNSSTTASSNTAKGDGDLLSQIHKEILSVTGIDLMKS
eukprot:gene13018-15016_t